MLNTMLLVLLMTQQGIGQQDTRYTEVRLCHSVSIEQPRGQHSFLLLKEVF